MAASASGGGIAAAASSLSIAARRSEVRASIDGSTGEMESGGDTTTPVWRLLAAATHLPLSVSASGGGTAAAANSLSVVDACSETRTPTDEPGQVPLVDPPQNASVAIASGCDAIATAGVLLAEAARSQTSALTDTLGAVPRVNPPSAALAAMAPANATPYSGGCAGECGDGHVGAIVPEAIFAATAMLAVANP